MPRRIDPSLVPEAPDFSFEIPLWDIGVHYVAGIDEAGRGPLAGPVTAATVIFPPEPDLMAVLKGVRRSGARASAAGNLVPADQRIGHRLGSRLWLAR